MKRQGEGAGEEAALRVSLRQQVAALPGRRIILAVSGGADSLALMHICARWQKDWRADFLVASVDHGWRGAAGREDLAMVKKWAAEWGLPCVSETVDARAYAECEGLNQEQAARKLRYRFLRSMAMERGYPAIFTAHHAEDQVETILDHLTRGCGLRGLAGMRVRQVLPGEPPIALIRPFLQFPKRWLLAYCQRHGLSPRVDETNADRRRKRNHLRHRTLPLLRHYNPRLDNALTRLAGVAAAAQDYLQRQAGEFLQQAGRPRRGAIEIARADFLNLHRALRAPVIHAALSALGEPQSPAQAVLEAALARVERGDGEKIHRLSADILLRRSGEQLIIERYDAPLPEDQPLLPAGFRHCAQAPATITLPDVNWSLQIMPDHNVANASISLPDHARFCLRARQAGDRFAPAGMNGRGKSLKRWLIDRKVPRYLRQWLPLLALKNEVAAIHCGGRWHISENYLPQNQPSSPSYRLEWRKSSS